MLAERVPRRRRVLIVDDDIAFNRMTAKLLRRYGIEVRQAHSINELLAALESESYALIVLDAHLPGEQQLDSLDELRARANDEVSVLVISGDPAAGQQLARTGERHRAPVEFLAKPIDPDVLVNRVQLVVAEP
ncbi:MAG: response regulator [Myxococcales bacterium]|nr:response regulator [Myxococcales bacterium]